MNEIEILRAALSRIENDRVNPWHTRVIAYEALRDTRPGVPPLPPPPKVDKPPAIENRGI